MVGDDVCLCVTSVNSAIKCRCKKEREAVKKTKPRRQSKVDENSHHRQREPRGEPTVVPKGRRLHPPGVLWCVVAVAGASCFKK